MSLCCMQEIFSFAVCSQMHPCHMKGILVPPNKLGDQLLCTPYMYTSVKMYVHQPKIFAFTVGKYKIFHPEAQQDHTK